MKAREKEASADDESEDEKQNKIAQNYNKRQSSIFGNFNFDSLKNLYSALISLTLKY